VDGLGTPPAVVISMAVTAISTFLGVVKGIDER
jgi:hypothetical protein